MVKVEFEIDDKSYKQLQGHVFHGRRIDTACFIRTIVKNFLSVTAFKHKPKVSEYEENPL